MTKPVALGAIIALVLPLAPAVARQMDGYTVRTTTLRAGPDYDYPAIQRLRPNTGLIVHGCLRNWRWCDVSNRFGRGWITARDIVVDDRGRRRGVSGSVGIGILSFMLGTYWESHYRNRPFYSERQRWEQRYYRNHRQEWGPLPRRPEAAPEHRPETRRQQDLQNRGREPRPKTPDQPPPYQDRPNEDARPHP